MIVMGKVESNDRSGVSIGLVEPTSQFSERHDSKVARALVRLDRDCIPLRCAHFSDETLKLHSGMNIAVLSQISSVGCSSVQHKRGAHDTHYTKGQIPLHLRDLYDRTTPNMDPRQKEQIAKLLLRYKDVFSASDHDLGKSGIIKHRIPTGDANPIRQPLRRVPVHLQDEIDRQVDSMLEHGIIQPSTSPWSSGIVLVQKKDGTHRFCIDYRQLNNVTVRDAYPLPRIDESLDQLSGAKWFSCLDLSSGYWQVEVEPEDRPKTAFATRRGLFEYRMMPFGLWNAPATFERLTESVLTGLHWHICLIYLDDIIVTGKSFDDMITKLGKVLERLAKYNLKLKPKKCQLFSNGSGVFGTYCWWKWSEDGPKEDRVYKTMARTFLC